MAENTTHPLSKRVRWDELHRQISKLAKDDRVQALDRLEDRAVAIVNPERQIVYLNAACARFSTWRTRLRLTAVAMASC